MEVLLDPDLKALESPKKLERSGTDRTNTPDTDADSKGSEKTPKRRRVSIFNRTNNPNTVTVLKDNTLSNIDEEVLETYCAKLKAEKESWTRALKESKERNAYLKGKLRTELKDPVDMDILSEEEKNFLLAAPDYSSYVQTVSELINKASTVAAAKQNFEQNLLYGKNKLQNMTNSTVNDLNKILHSEF